MVKVHMRAQAKQGSGRQRQAQKEMKRLDLAVSSNALSRKRSGLRFGLDRASSDFFTSKRQNRHKIRSSMESCAEAHPVRASVAGVMVQKFMRCLLEPRLRLACTMPGLAAVADRNKSCNGGTRKPETADTPDPRNRNAIHSCFACK